MKIFLVWNYDYEQSFVYAAYSSIAEAERCAQKEGEHTGVEECELDPEPFVSGTGTPINRVAGSVE